MGLFNEKTENAFNYIPFNYMQKDEIEQVLEIYSYLKGKHSREFENDLLEFIEKTIKRNKK